MKQDDVEYYTFQTGNWIVKSFAKRNDIAKFTDIRYFYANIIDYIRLIMIVLATYLTTTDWHLSTALLILGSTLLDLIDGPIARAYNQCSIFGCGIDWFADILGEITILVWWARYDFSAVPWLFIVIFIELGTGLFDFGTTTTLKYPILKKNKNPFFAILDWSMPLNTYSLFGNFIWYAYPLYCVVRILEYCYEYSTLVSTTDLSFAIQDKNFILILFLLNRYCLFIPSLLYIWCELAYCIHIIQSWMEPSRTKEAANDDIIYDDASTSYQGGFIHYKTLSNEYKSLLEICYEDIQLVLKDRYRSALERREVFWINLWKRSGDSTEVITLKHHHELETLVYTLMDKYYQADSVLLDGYGYLLNPMDSRSQPFHIDYNCDYSSLFIPLVPLSADNSVQYIIPSPSIAHDLFEEATKNCDNIDVNLLLKNQNYYSVRQCVSNPFAVLKMDFGTIHRAISNQGKYHRPIFYISVIRKNSVCRESIPDEPLIETIKKYE